MERRQGAAGFGQWEKPVYGTGPTGHPAQFRDEAARCPAPGSSALPRTGPNTEYQHGLSLPRMLPQDNASDSGRPWHNRPHREGPRRPQYGDPLIGFRQHGAPQYSLYTQKGSSPDTFQQQPALPQHGDFQSSAFHHGNVRSDSMHKDRPPPQVLPEYNPPQSMLQTEVVGDFSYGGPHSNTFKYTGHQQSMSQPKGELSTTPQNGSQPLQRAHDYRKEHLGISSEGGPLQRVLDYKTEVQGIVQDRSSQQDMSHQGERPPHIHQHRDTGSTVSHQDAQKSGMACFADSLSKDAQPGGQQQGRLHNDPSHSKNNELHMYQFDGSLSDMVHNRVQHTTHQFDHKHAISSFGGAQAGTFNAHTPLNRPLQNDASQYRAPSPIMVQQGSTQLPTMPLQAAPYVHNIIKGHHNFPPPFRGNLANLSFITPPPIGHVFSGFGKNVDLKVLPHQSQVNELQSSLNQEQLNMQMDDRFKNRDLFNAHQKESHLQPEIVHSEKLVQQHKPFSQKDGGREGPFLQQDITDLQRDLHFLPQHRFSEFRGGQFVPHNASNPQLGDNLMHVKGESEKDAFQQWLSCFLAGKRKTLSPELDATQPTISITEARVLIYSALELVSQLDSLCQTLENRNEAEESWTQDYEKASDIRKELERKLKELEKPGYIQCVKKKLDRVRKKRQRRRQAAEDEEKEAKERAAEKEAVIDRWRMQCIQAVEEKKRERELKAAADSVLAEVRKKQTDAKKMLDVLKSLEKLRKLRKEAAGRKGVFPPASADATFKNQTDRLRTMVHKRIALYDAEERALRVILEGEQEEERQRDKDKRLKKDKEKVLQKQRELDSVLFGDPELLPNLHPFQPFRQYYLQAENSVVSLVQIRHAWDQFLVPPDHPDGSSIPRGWVVPTLPSSDIWATALKQAE